MSTGTLLFFLLVLACPLMMFFMHRGGQHGSHEADDHSMHGGHERGRADSCEETGERRSLDELRAERDALDARIEELERAQERDPVAGAR